MAQLTENHSSAAAPHRDEQQGSVVQSCTMPLTPTTCWYQLEQPKHSQGNPLAPSITRNTWANLTPLQTISNQAWKSEHRHAAVQDWPHLFPEAQELPQWEQNHFIQQGDEGVVHTYLAMQAMHVQVHWIHPSLTEGKKCKSSSPNFTPGYNWAKQPIFTPSWRTIGRLILCNADEEGTNIFSLAIDYLHKQVHSDQVAVRTQSRKIGQRHKKCAVFPNTYNTSHQHN